MSKLMFIFGILFLAAGVALGLLIHFSPGEMQVRGLTPDVAAILVVGGALCLGLGSTIGALRDRAVAPVVADVITETPEAAVEKPATPKFTGFGKKTAAAVVATEALDPARRDRPQRGCTGARRTDGRSPRSLRSVDMPRRRPGARAQHDIQRATER